MSELTLIAGVRGKIVIGSDVPATELYKCDGGSKLRVSSSCWGYRSWAPLKEKSPDFSGP